MPIAINSKAAGFIIVTAALGIVTVSLLAGIWGVADTLAVKGDSLEFAEMAVWLDPSNPRTHYSLARQLENTLEPDAIRRSIKEYETSVALAPRNYFYWLALGRAKERAGEDGEAELRQALELAPNYSRVLWAVGNALVRKGKIEEGFVEIRRAISTDETLAGAAAALAWDLNSGDADAAAKLLNNEPTAMREIIIRLAENKQFDNSFRLFDALPPYYRNREDFVNNLAAKFIAGKRFRQAAFILAAVSPESFPKVATVTNGGFENDVRREGTVYFDWSVGAGTHPQIARTDTIKSEGNYSLLIAYTGSATADFRRISQLIAVTPGKSYRLRFNYKSELKSDAAFRWEVASAADLSRLAVSEPFKPTSEWKTAEISFRTPDNSDGIVIQMILENCRPQLCSISGKLWLDDFRLEDEN